MKDRLRSTREEREHRVTTPLWPRAEVLTKVPTGFFGSADFLGRVGILGALALAAFAVLGLRLWSLQTIQGGKLRLQGVAEATRAVTLPGARGAIIDAEGRPLAGTNGALDVTADPQTLGTRTATGWVPSLEGEQLLRRLASVSHTSLGTLVTRIRDDVIQDPFAPAIVLNAVSEPLAAYLSERERAYRGLSVTPLPSRSYPQRGLGGTFLGLLGQLSPAEITSGTYPWAKAGEAVGQSGVEATYDKVLNGGLVKGMVRVDAAGREVSPIAWIGATHRPATLQLTISSRLQRAADRALRYGIEQAHRAGYADANGGAAVVMNPRTGAIEALASSPELNQKAAADDPAYLARLLRAPGGASPLFDPATQGIYPLGSTFKPVVAEAALSAGLITPWSTLPCVGSLTVGGIVFHNVETWINASLTLPQALEISCDTWFYRLGEDFFSRQLEGDFGIQTWANLFGFGHATGLDIPGESAGVVPTPGWLGKTLHQQWYEGDSVNLSIGQGFLEATPLQLAVAYSTLANGGTVVRPHVGEAVIENGQRTRLAFPPVRRLKLRDLWAIRQGLYLAAHGASGTSAAVFGNYPIAVDGKTGTAQTPTGSDDSWYASWAPAGNPKVVVVVLIEHGGFGADAAAPAARQIYDAIFHLKTSGV
jgi:penicillin-binding protein 2